MANLQEELFNNILAICPTEADFENLLGLKVTIEVGHLLLLFTDTNPLCVVLVLVLQKTMPPKEKVEWWTLRHSTFNTNKYLIDIVIQLSRDRLDNLDHEYITLRHHVAFTAFPTYKAFFAKRFF